MGVNEARNSNPELAAVQRVIIYAPVQTYHCAKIVTAQNNTIRNREGYFKRRTTHIMCWVSENVRFVGFKATYSM